MLKMWITFFTLQKVYITKKGIDIIHNIWKNNNPHKKCCKIKVFVGEVCKKRYKKVDNDFINPQVIHKLSTKCG